MQTKYSVGKVSKKEKIVIQNKLKEHWGIKKEATDKMEFFKRKDDLWITTKAAKTNEHFQKKGIKINNIGMRAIRNSFTKSPKVTTNFVQLIDKEITKNIKELTKEELEKYTKGEDLERDENLEGFCILKYNNRAIGVGLIQQDRIKNQIPKSRRIKGEVK
jgi:NOL1/NOP2/fmu family ribosome biogenesis protein